MKLAPRIIQAMEILQLPMLALEQRIESELESNPVLEAQAAGADEQAPAVRDEDAAERGERPMVVKDENNQSDDFQRLADFTDEYGTEFITSDAPPRPRKAPSGERDRKLDAMANTPAPAESLNEHLLEQWRFVEAPENVKSAGELIINEIDEDGYFRTPPDELPDKTNRPVAMPDIQEALRLVQTLDPIGVGARDLKECLLIQLAVEAAAGRDVSLEITLVQRFLREIEMNHMPLIAKRAGKTLEQIKGAIENLSHLNPRPGLLVGERIVPVILPDVIVDFDEKGDLVVGMSDRNAPRLSISTSYRKLARRRGTDGEARRFLQKNIRSAEWLIGAIEQRRGTIRRVAEEVFKVQREFLEVGEEALKPLPMADVAGRVGVHVATVSRAVSGKYVQTPRGIYPLRMFFSGGITTAKGEDVSWDAVKAKLKEIVDAEDKSHPLNDDLLAAELRKHGLNIARRTVAKYRNLLDISSARKRRQY